MAFWTHTSKGGQPPLHQVTKAVRVLAAVARDPLTAVHAWQLNRLHDLPRCFGISGAAMALKPYRPFGCAHWSPATKLERLADHFAVAEALGGVMAPALGQPRQLLDLSTLAPDLWLGIDEIAAMMQDGLTVLSLMHADTRVFQVTFTLAEQGGGLEVYLGGLQGRAGELDFYRDLTKACHGLRPRDLMIEAFRFFCAAIGVRRIRAIAEAATYHSDPYFGAHPYQMARMNYDEIWADRGGTALDEAWFDLPLQSQQRDAEEIPARKRALYRRRYAMLDALRLEIGEAVAAHIPGAAAMRELRSRPKSSAVALRAPTAPGRSAHRRARVFSSPSTAPGLSLRR